MVSSCALSDQRLSALSETVRPIRDCPPFADENTSLEISAGRAGEAHLPHRGFGMELEFLTQVGRVNCGAPGNQSLLTAKTAELHAALETVLCSARAGSDAESLAAACRRAREWTVTVDEHIAPSPLPVAQRVVEWHLQEAGGAVCVCGETAEAHGVPPNGAALSQTFAQRALRLLQGKDSKETVCMKAEFRSPAPPHELSISSAADAAAVACVMRALRTMGVAAPPATATGFSGSAVHIHVNVCSPIARGDPLSAREVLNVWLAWTVFDSVLAAAFARPWMWREPSCAPLYASGAEMSAAAAAAWSLPSSSPEAPGPAYDAFDVPAFLAGVHEALRRPEYAALPDELSRRRWLFDPDDSPASGLTRYCSLNLHRVTSYGTLEFRRFHGTSDATTLLQWASFCVCFVDAARGFDASAFLDASLPEALKALRAAQETATASELLELLGGGVPATVADCLLQLGTTA